MLQKQCPLTDQQDKSQATYVTLCEMRMCGSYLGV